MPQEAPEIRSIRQRLKNVSVTLGSTFNETLRLYFLEGFLRRVAASSVQTSFVLGGAMVLFKIGLGPMQARHTQDADFSVQGLPNDAQTIRTLLQTIAGLSPAPVADELAFDPSSVVVAPILLAQPQIGLQARLSGTLGKARDTITLDCSFDPIVPPGPQLRDLPATLPGTLPIPLWTVPLEGIMAGKIESMLRRGATTTRYKDYWDIARLAEIQTFSGDRVFAALQATCAQHGTQLDPSAEVFASPTFPTDPLQEANWGHFLARLHSATPSASSFAEVIQRVRALYRPVIQGSVSGKTWSPLSRSWQ